MINDEGEAEDIMQVAFIRAYETRSKFQGDEVGFKRWLYRITFNLCMDVYRKRHPHLGLEQMKEKGFEPAIEFSHSGLEAEDEIWQAMDCLNSKQRSVVVLRYLHELSYEEIAKILRLPLGTVKSRLNTSIKILRKKLVRENYEL